MRYFFLSLLILVAIFGLQWVVVDQSPDRSVESGIQRDGSTDATRKQSQEDMSVHESQRRHD